MDEIVKEIFSSLRNIPRIPSPIFLCSFGSKCRDYICICGGSLWRFRNSYRIKNFQFLRNDRID